MKKITLLFSLFFIATGVIVFTPAETNAANKNDFNPGYIIDDYVFYNDQSMDTNQIQTFLNSKVPNCDYNGTQSASDWGYPGITHAQLAEYKRNGSNGFSQDSGFHAPPYKCLTMYTQNTPQMEAASGLCGAIPAYTNRSAAQIIKDISTACSINPQVLVILLEKEQSLVTDNWPLNRQLDKATGFACPDSAPCDPSYGGFYYQVYYAARQFKVYKAYPNNYNYIAGRNNTIKWNPQSSCGTSSVYIQNQATAALYIYTPYRPNQVALDNLYGTGDGCSSYGNRNFWRIFTDWFGSTKTVLNEVSSRYDQLGGATGALGKVQSTGYCTPDHSGCWQEFQNGYIIWSAANGAWESKGAIRDRWGVLGYQGGALGYPIGPEVYDGKGFWQSYQNGAIVGTATTGYWESKGAIRDRWGVLGYQGGALGYPIGKVETSIDESESWQQYQNGYIVQGNTTGAWESKGAIRTYWAQIGYQDGVAGLPTGPETFSQATSTYSQTYENGTISHKTNASSWFTKKP